MPNTVQCAKALWGALMVSTNRVIQELREDFAPYAATSNVVDVILRRREWGLPNSLTANVLETISIPTGNISRTLQALRFLGLMEDDGSQTELFERLGRAGEKDGEYRELLGEIIMGAYHRVFAIVDPSEDGDVAIHDAFRQFGPEAQRDRMVTFFLGMCERAGIIQPRGRERRAEGSRDGQQRRRRSVVQPQRQRRERVQVQETQRRAIDEDTDSHLIFAVIRQLPAERQWTATRRQRWLTAVEAAVDLMVDVVEDNPQPVENEEAQ